MPISTATSPGERFTPASGKRSRRPERSGGAGAPQAPAPRPHHAGAARPAARLLGRLLPGPDRDRRPLQRRQALARPRPARGHARGLARLPAQPGLPEAVLEVGQDVAGRLDRRRRARLPARLLPGAVGDEAEVRPPPAADRALPDELPAAGARLEGDPRQPGRDQLLRLLDRAALAGPPDLTAAL